MFDSYVDLSAPLRYGRDDNLWICFVLGLLSFLFYLEFLVSRIVFYSNYVQLIVISTGGSFCFRSGEIFLIDMWFLEFVFLMVLFF